MEAHHKLGRPAMPPLVAIKLIHTLVWAFMVACIAAVPWAAQLGRWGLALACSGIVLAEGLVLAVNRMRCPLTDLAARHTDRREANFDIYLPLWLARHNQAVFGALWAAGELYAFGVWRGYWRF